tara:strand:- start:755 stop:958 length:204 start_codon:yes stop_codon:yes gene_type:complete
MSGEYASNSDIITSNEAKNKRKSVRKVDINILLNKVRADQKREKFENGIFFGLVAAVIIVTGIIISL